MNIDSDTFHCYDSRMGTDDAVAIEAREGLSLAELTEAAGVSVRTVRYYIGEGLLPPPAGAGPGTTYSQGHFDGLRLIQRMKADYLPLREIRRRLAGLDDTAVREQLAQVATEEAAPAWDRHMAAARDYLALMEAGQPYQATRLPLHFQSPAPPVADQGPVLALAENPGKPSLGAAASRSAPHPAPPVANPSPPLWRRIPLGDEAELVISDRVYDRYRERVEWLVRWARKVFG